MADTEAVIDCSTGEIVYQPLTDDETASLHAAQREVADAKAAEAADRKGKIDRAKAAIARNPDLQAVLDVLGVRLQ